MNLQESIKRILRETREDKVKSLLLQEFNKVFDELNLKVDYEENNYVYGKWFDKDGKDIFHRNDWGVIWIINCEPYKELYIYSKLVDEVSKFFSLDYGDSISVINKWIENKLGIKSINVEVASPIVGY